MKPPARTAPPPPTGTTPTPANRPILGAVPSRAAAGKLEPARTRFLDWLADQTAGRDAVLRVVFDAKAAPAASPETDYRGVRVAFAFGRTADERIEELVAAEPRPGRV